MPTRTYYFPSDFLHVEAILQAEIGEVPDATFAFFRDAGIAPILSAGNLPLLMGISPKIFHSIYQKKSKHYRSFKLRKRDGSFREIETPRTYLKVIQWWILDNILSKIYPRSCVFGFVRGRSAVDNAIYHSGSSHLLNMDIRNFFNSISQNSVERAFSGLGYDDKVGKALAELCCYNGRVPQGAPTSPAIANLILQDFDRQVEELAESSGIKYSRYADDLTFSSSDFIKPSFVQQIKSAVENHGFQVKDEKTRFSGSGNRMEITGVIINEVLQPTRTWRKSARAKIHKIRSSNQLKRKDFYFLTGINSMPAQFPQSQQILNLAKEAKSIIDERAMMVVGIGEPKILPNSLTLRQAEALAALAPNLTNEQVAIKMGVSLDSLKKRLQIAYKKVGVDNRLAAYHWAKENL
ncbi:MAG: retron St85 family RNA-directed DNA polymerase [Novosphingobium sp.]|uniref:retron St85 family RNA-directed DNA polymerase n=1 Tax=Novosphingobium sp. TaxID=1874826 RepID=UPI0027363F4C|nr:retron St85 family RNA-directed DNA polymerase [Novosphingobium sp.]MDP3550446.1 retron St85 family RNA-directed DNA polymerase [Novosphingobium sp.]